MPFPNLTAFALAFLAAAPAVADKKLDEAVAKAEAQLAKGKDDEAVKILQKAAAQASRDPEAPLALASLLARLGRLDDARVAFGRAGELSAAAAPPVRARVLATRSAFELRSGQAGDALTLARQAVDARAGADELAALARAQARLGDPAARATADKAVQAAATSAPAQLARGDALLAARLAKDAEAAYQRALELSPKWAPAGTGLAFALAAQGKGARAIEVARAATQADARSGEAHAALGLGALAQDPQDKGNEAVSAAQQASFLEPKNPLVKLLLGRVFESRGQLDQANAAYTEAAGLDTTWPAPRVAMLGLQFRTGDVDGALAGVRALPPELKRSGEAQLLLGRLLLKKEDAPDAAKAALDHAVAALPGIADAQAALGTASYNVGELKQAADAYGRAVALEPDNLDYLSNYGLFLGYDERLDQGLAVLLKVTERPDVKDPGPFVNLGWIYRHFDPPRVTRGRGRVREGAEARSEERPGRARHRAQLPRGKAMGARRERVRPRLSDRQATGGRGLGRHGLVLLPRRRPRAHALLHRRRGPPGRGRARAAQRAHEGAVEAARAGRAGASAPEGGRPGRAGGPARIEERRPAGARGQEPARDRQAGGSLPRVRAPRAQQPHRRARVDRRRPRAHGTRPRARRSPSSTT